MHRMEEPGAGRGH